MSAAVRERHRFDLPVRSRQDLPGRRGALLDLGHDADAGLPERGDKRRAVARRRGRRDGPVLAALQSPPLGREDVVENAHPPPPFGLWRAPSAFLRLSKTVRAAPLSTAVRASS